MTRVYAKSNPDRLGTIVGDAPHGDVLVEWEGEDFRWRIRRDQLVEVDELAIMPEGAKPPQHHLELQLLDALDRLRDGVNLAIERAIRDIHRTMGKK